jgi:hypothetical protein
MCDISWEIAVFRPFYFDRRMRFFALPAIEIGNGM